MGRADLLKITEVKIEMEIYQGQFNAMALRSLFSTSKFEFGVFVFKGARKLVTRIRTPRSKKDSQR